MKKSNLIKLFSILVISVMTIMFCTGVFAADENDFQQLTLSNSSNSGNTGNGSTTGNNASGNQNTKLNNTNAKSNNSNTNSSNIYNNTNLPKTGMEDSIPVAMLIVVFGVSAVYAYKKIKDYRNI